MDETENRCRKGMFRATFTLRALFVCLTFACAVLAYWRGFVAVQSRAVAAVHNAGGRVIHENWLINGRIDPFGGSDQPTVDPPAAQYWMEEVLGPDWFSHVAYVTLDNAYASDEIACLVGRLDNVQGVVLARSCCNQTVGSVPVTDVGVKALSELSSLTLLDLTNTQVTDRGMKHVGELRELKKLDMAYTNVGDDSAPHLARLHRLEILCLTGTQFTDAGLAGLQSLPNLKHLYVPNTAITEQGIARFEAAVPGCTVYWQEWGVVNDQVREQGID